MGSQIQNQNFETLTSKHGEEVATASRLLPWTSKIIDQFADSNKAPNLDDQLLWVILIGLVFALITQSLVANLGVSTGKHLAELCKSEYPLFIKYCLWILAEIAVIAADIPEVIGTAFALNILFHISSSQGLD